MNFPDSHGEHIGSVDWSHVPGNPVDRKTNLKVALTLAVFGWFCLVGAWVTVNAVVDFVRGL